jgi:putative ABC transport system ATP-binding protein
VPVVQFDHVVKEYTAQGTAVRALNDVSLAVEAGEFVSLVGRSGCGKTTLLNLAGAMDFPTSGKVLIEGQETSGRSDAELTQIRRSQVGFVFQFFQLLPTLTAAENVELPLQLSGRSEVRDAALDRLRLVEMESFASRYPHQLSGGQMQRVAIARAIVHSPRILLADEPIGNLDSTSAEVVMQLLRRIADDTDTAILMATHSLDAAQVTDTIVQLRDGRIEDRHSVS